MHTGDAASLAAKEAEARALADQVAALLEQLHQLGPVSAGPGVLRTPGGEIRRGFEGWEVR
ncbi:hypothetical protein JHN49_04530 [Streptomyces sp. MBT57]|nr:hypothetical protein [Streptomyces sp. MBT57]